MSDDLIDRLAGEVRPVDPTALIKRLALAIGVGGSIGGVGMVLLLGLRPDFPQALGSQMFWVKAAYTLGFGGLGLWAVERLARPGGRAFQRLPWLAAPLVAIAALAVVQLATTPDESHHSLLMGGSGSVCPWWIAACATPMFVALTWTLRSLAPTRLRLTGAIAGLTAGGFGAAIYALHCPEVGAPFVGLWYTAGIVAPAAVGALLGPRTLRW